MYWLRGVLTSLGVFFLCYTGLSTLVILAWRMLRGKAAVRCAGILYGMRVLPLMGASVTVALFALPSFVYLEPRLAQERIGLAAFALAACGALVVVLGFRNGVRAWWNTSRLTTLCLKCSRPMETTSPTPVYEVPSDTPLIFVAGLRNPKVMISRSVLALLEPDEIDAAISHEIAHVHRRDNIKKMVLCACGFPLLGSLECEWLRAAETAADDAAARNEETALSLASALLKIATLSARLTTPELGMMLLPENGESLRLRVENLLSGRKPDQENRRITWYALPLFAAVFVSMNYLWLLLRAHEFTELLIR